MQRSVYLPIFLWGSILCWQRVVSLSRLNQLLFNSLFLLKHPNTQLSDMLFPHREMWNNLSCATLTMSLAGTGAGWAAGLISFKVSDSAARALSASASSWIGKQQDNRTKWSGCGCRVCVRLRAAWAELVFYLWGSLCRNTCSSLHCRCSSGGNKVSCQGIQSQVCRGLREGQNPLKYVYDYKENVISEWGFVVYLR